MNDILGMLMSGGKQRGDNVAGKLFNQYITAVIKVKAVTKNYTVAHNDLAPALRDEVIYQVAVINNCRLALKLIFEPGMLVHIGTLTTCCFGQYQEYVDSVIDQLNDNTKNAPEWHEDFKAVVKAYDPTQFEDEDEDEEETE